MKQSHPLMNMSRVQIYAIIQSGFVIQIVMHKASIREISNVKVTRVINNSVQMINESTPWRKPNVWMVNTRRNILITDKFFFYLFQFENVIHKTYTKYGRLRFF